MRVLYILCLSVVCLCFLCEAASYEEAVSLYQGGNPGLYDAYQEILQRGTDNELVYLDLAVLYKERGRYCDAIEVIKKLLHLRPNKNIRNEASFLLGELHYLEGKEKEAEEVFRKMITHNPWDWRGYVYLGLVYESMKKMMLAEKYYRETLKIKESSVALYRLGKIYYGQRNYGQAAKYFEKTIDFDSSIRTAYFYLGECLLKTREYALAYNFLAKALTFFPENKAIKGSLERVKTELGKEYFSRRQELIEKKRKEKKLAAYKKEKADVPQMRVRIFDGARQFTFKCGGEFTCQGNEKSLKGKKDTFYTVVYKSPHTVEIYAKEENKRRFQFKTPLRVEAEQYPFYILDVTYGKGDFWQKNIDTVYKGSLEIESKEDTLFVINALDLETYLCGVIAAEIPASSPLEALKAQAVAARTLAVRNMGRHRKEGFNFCSGTHCQVYRGATVETPSTTRAVKETKGLVILYEGKPIEAFYHSNCGGCMRADVFESPPYLFSHKFDGKGETLLCSPWYEEVWFRKDYECYCSKGRRSNFRWQRVYDGEDFELTFGFALGDLIHIFPLKKGDCGHLTEVEVLRKKGAQQIRGSLKVRTFFDNIKSSLCKIEVKYIQGDGVRTPSMLCIWGAGFGHGAGLCQEGAIGQAQEGRGYKEILTHYYKDVEIRKIY